MQAIVSASLSFLPLFSPNAFAQILQAVFVFLPILLIKKRDPKVSLIYVLDFKSTDGRSGECHRSGLSSSEIQREVMSITLMHDFHTKTSAVENVCPSVDHFTL